MAYSCDSIPNDYICKKSCANDFLFFYDKISVKKLIKGNTFNKLINN